MVVDLYIGIVYLKYMAAIRYAINNNANITDINNEGIISIINGRHPLIDKNKVVPISLKLGIDYDALIIT